MQLPYSEHQTTSSIEDSINTVLTGPQNEIELAASRHFYDDKETYDGKTNVEISDIYDEFFRVTADKISNILGQPMYQDNELPDRLELAETLGIDPNFNNLVVWKKGDRSIYLQSIWEDYDCPIVISLGAS